MALDVKVLAWFGRARKKPGEETKTRSSRGQRFLKCGKDRTESDVVLDQARGDN
jgi:hypothetical protein